MSYCQAPWINRFIRADGTEFPCCLWNQKHTYDQQTTQEQMLAGNTVSGCSHCNHMPVGQDRYRQYWNAKSNTEHSIEISVDNVCNLECVMCSSLSSHKAARREKLLLGQSVAGDTIISNRVYETVDWSKVTSVRLYGGEPTYSPGVKHMLETVNADWSNIDLIMNTNATIVPDNTLQHIMSQCRSVEIGISLDGWANTNQFQRQGEVAWETIVSVLDWWSSTDYKITVAPTITPYTVFDYNEFVERVTERWSWPISPNMCVDPPWHNIQNMPEELKQQVKCNDGDINDFVCETGNTEWFDVFCMLHPKTQELRGLKFNNSVLQDAIDQRLSLLDMDKTMLQLVDYVSGR